MIPLVSTTPNQPPDERRVKLLEDKVKLYRGCLEVIAKVLDKSTPADRRRTAADIRRMLAEES